MLPKKAIVSVYRYGRRGGFGNWNAYLHGMYALGFDIGSSSIKVAILNLETRKMEADAFSLKNEMTITAVKAGWAEQDPSMWWEKLKQAISEALASVPYSRDQIIAIGISYQMHGLVVVEKQKRVHRSSIIWCDSRAVEIGQKAFSALGPVQCFSSLLNSPGNITASKLCWLKENELKIFEKIDKFLLPSDYIATFDGKELASGNYLYRL